MKSTKGKEPEPKSALQEHSFLTDAEDVKEMERGLLNLMDDFNHGRLHAFGRECTIEKMDRVRELQERLAQTHFEMDNKESFEQNGNSNSNMERLTKDLESLSSTIQSLHQQDGTLY